MADIPQTNLFVPCQFFTFTWYDYEYESPYNSDPYADLDVDVNYAQPIQCGGGDFQSDTGKIQVTSDFVPSCALYKCSNELVKNIPLTAIDPPILGVSFICYNGEIDFSDVDPGLYYTKITYTDENDVIRDWRTPTIDVQIYHPGTQLIEATNTTNDKGAVFVQADLSLLVVPLRVASYMYLPLVKTDAQDYEDQYNELIQESSIPFVTLTQILGGPLLLPFREIEKINLLYSLNKVTIDGKPFAKIAGQDFRPKRADFGNKGGIWEVDIQPNTVYPSDIFVTGDPAEEDYIVIKQAKIFKAKSANFAFTGNFTSGKNLIRLAVKNIGLDEFELLVGATEGDDSIARFTIPAELDNSLDIGKLFTAPTDVWISGIAGTNLDITFDWNDYLAKNVIPGVPVSQFAKNTVYYFKENTPGSFAVEFDVASGLGNVGTDHEGCVLAGTNGTDPIEDMVIRGWDRTLPLTRETTIGADEVTLLKANIPSYTAPVGMDIKHDNGGPGGVKVLSSQNPGPGGNGTLNLPIGGNGDPIVITPFSIILPAFYYIGT